MTNEQKRIVGIFKRFLNNGGGKRYSTIQAYYRKLQNIEAAIKEACSFHNDAKTLEPHQYRIRKEAMKDFFNNVNNVKGAVSNCKNWRFQVGLEVLHVIHRHGLTEEEALIVEAALIDAYPGIANIQNGKDSGDYGWQSVEEIISLYKAEDVEFKEDDKLLLIKITDGSIESSGNIYEAVRKFWILNPQKANRAQYVLAVKGGIVVGIFTVNENGWQSEVNSSNRYYFDGNEVKDGAIVERFKNHRIPDKYRKKGAANPIRYVGL